MTSRAERETAEYLVAERLGIDHADARRIVAAIRPPPREHADAGRAWHTEWGIADYCRNLPLAELAELAGREVPQ